MERVSQRRAGAGRSATADGSKGRGPDVGRVSRSHDFTAEGAARPASRAGNGGTVLTLSNPTVVKARSRLSAQLSLLWRRLARQP